MSVSNRVQSSQKVDVTEIKHLIGRYWRGIEAIEPLPYGHPDLPAAESVLNMISDEAVDLARRIWQEPVESAADLEKRALLAAIWHCDTNGNVECLEDDTSDMASLAIGQLLKAVLSFNDRGKAAWVRAIVG